jgi:hypothetical protein
MTAHVALRSGGSSFCRLGRPVGSGPQARRCPAPYVWYTPTAARKRTYRDFRGGPILFSNGSRTTARFRERRRRVLHHLSDRLREPRRRRGRSAESRLRKSPAALEVHRADRKYWSSLYETLVDGRKRSGLSVQQATQQRLFLAVWEFGHCAPGRIPLNLCAQVAAAGVTAEGTAQPNHNFVIQAPDGLASIWCCGVNRLLILAGCHHRAQTNALTLVIPRTASPRIQEGRRQGLAGSRLAGRSPADA